MPVYEYICDECGGQEEEVRTIAERDRVTYCKTCKSVMRRGIGNNGGFRLGGSGWAEDGYSDYIGDIEKTKGRPLTYADIHGPLEE